MKKFTNLSKTKIKFRSKKKTHPSIVQTLDLALENKHWLNVAKLLAGPRRAYKKVNLSELESQSESGDVIVVIGKVLSLGELSKKIKLRAMSYSKEAEAKLKKSKADYSFVLDEIKDNKEAKGVKILS